MSHGTADDPEVVVKPGKMFNYWTIKMKVVAVLLGLGIYVYFVLFIKTMYMKTQRLDHIMKMAEDTEKLIHKVHMVDQNLAIKMEKLDKAYLEYY